jgi:multidrug efflux system membrane fusion protein
VVETLKQVTVVPDDAVQHGPNGLFAYVVGNDNKVGAQNITVGQEDSGQSVVLKGLSPGQKVVTEGQYRLQQGALVQPSEASSPSTPVPAAPTSPVKAP